MKKTKEFFVVLFSILICVFLVIFIVQATTTISTDIATGGTVAVSGAGAATEFSVIGTVSISEDLWASGSVQFGAGEGTGTLSYSRFGAGTTDHSLADADDVLITGLLEVDATASFDNAVSISSVGIVLDDGITITSGTASPSGNCQVGSIYLRSGVSSASLIFNICDGSNSWTPLASVGAGSWE
jgi:hypothetical protein